MIFSRQKYIALHLYLHRRLKSSTTRVILKGELPLAAYKPEFVEKNKYDKWMEEGRFKAEASKTRRTFSMVLPPPNITGNLHLGHALACTIQDVIVRRRRSLGDNVLWLPGTDHAGIATQGVVERHLKTTQDKNRHDIGRESFIKEVWKWRERHGDTIIKQLRILGCSLDWSRQTFTMDRKHTNAVNTAFINLFKKDLIYRKKALVNWCTALKSTVSDIEVENVNISGPTDLNVPGYEKPVKFGLLYDFSYKILDSNEEIVVSTTMPETMLGDTAIAVHPDDERYKHLRGKRALHPFRNTNIPIIANDFVDMKFGTGAVKITPAHSKTDYEIAKHQNLPLLQVINEEGLMMNAGKFNKKKRYDCRQLLLDTLERLGLLKNVRHHQMTLPVCSRSGDVINHLPKEQWFLKCSELNERVANLIRSGKLNIDPDKFINNWFNWTEDDRDWCISRQLWWGHQIPAFKCSCEKDVIWIAAVDDISAKQQASVYLRTLPDHIVAERDTDVLDTWFSSGIYPFASLGWPENLENKDYRVFYPLNLMATGHDILGFWVHRMVILGLELTGKLPFHKVLLHGIICDSKGAKMSKSRGNVIDPIDVIKGISMEGLKKKTEDMVKYGTLNNQELQRALSYHKSNFSNTHGIPECGVDALRFTLLSQDIKSHFVSFDVAACNSNKLFCNKIWQSIKYTQLVYAKLKLTEEEITIKDLTCFDKWILSKLAQMVEKVNTSMDAYNFHLATTALRTLIYNEFCDVYLESTKPGFENENVKVGYAHAHTLSVVLNTALRCLSPFMIYLTDEVIPRIPAFEKNIVHNFDDASKKYYDFPQYEDFKHWEDVGNDIFVEKLLSAVNFVRELKAMYNISNKLRPAVIIKSKDKALIEYINENSRAFLNFTRCSDVIFNMDDSSKKYSSGVLNNDIEVFIEIISDDADNTIIATRDKIEKKINKLTDILSKMELKFSSTYYMTNVPEWTQVLDREKLESKKKDLVQLQRLIKEYKKSVDKNS